MLLLKLNPIEPPWYGPVCPVVWEGRRREVSPYPDQYAPSHLWYHLPAEDGAADPAKLVRIGAEHCKVSGTDAS